MPAGLSAVSVLLLALLQERPMHPYEAFGLLEQRHDTRLVRVNAGAVYHGFDRLERDGLAARIRIDRHGRRPQRTTYDITDAGREALAARIENLLCEIQPPYPLFPVGLAEADNLELRPATAALRHRLQRQLELAEHHRGVLERLRVEGLPRRHLLDIEYEEAMMSAEATWLEALIADIENGSVPWREDLPFSDAKDAAAPTTRSEP